jgi:hypothetical protein
MVVNIAATITLGSSCDYARQGNNAGRFFAVKAAAEGFGTLEG